MAHSMNTKIIPNPTTESSDSTKIQARIDPKIHDYFFRFVGAGERGLGNNLVNIFFVKLHEQCIFEGIKPEFSVDNLASIRNILTRLNFNGPEPTKPARARRTNSATPKRSV